MITAWIRNYCQNYSSTIVDYRKSMLQVIPLERYLPWKGLRGCVAGKTPFSLSLSRSTRPPFQRFSVPQDPHFNQKSQNFPIFCSKCLNLVNFQFLSLKFWPISSSGSLIWAKNQFLKQHFCQKNKQTNKQIHQAPKFGANPFYKPLIFGP